MFYQQLKHIVAICFNLLNILLGGNLPPLVCVSTIVEQDGSYLLVERPGGKYVFPGEFMRWHEHPEQAARREGKEETGFDLGIIDIVGYQSYTSRSFYRMSTVNLVYRAKIVSGTLRTSIEGRPYWLSESEFAGKLSPLAQGMFDEYIKFRAQH